MMKILETILSFLFPTSCIVCNTEGSDICTKCLASFENPKPTNYDWIMSLWNYHDPNVEKLMRHIKNIPNRRIATILANEVVVKVERELAPGERENLELSKIKNAVIIPIPIGRARFRSRGYNQSLLLARPLAHLLHRTILENTLIKTKHTKKQGTTKNKSERIHNIEGSFEVLNREKIKNRDIILVDDITTTGITLFEARKILLAAGARNVVAITIAN